MESRKNVYNTTVDRPRVKIGNWVEQLSLYETSLNPDSTKAQSLSACPTMYIHEALPNQKMEGTTSNREYGVFSKTKEHVFDPETNPDTIGKPRFASTMREGQYSRQAHLEWNEYTRMRSERLDSFADTIAREGASLGSTTRTDYYHEQVDYGERSGRWDLPLTTYNAGLITVGRSSKDPMRMGRHAAFSTPIEYYDKKAEKDE